MGLQRTGSPLLWLPELGVSQLLWRSFCGGQDAQDWVSVLLGTSFSLSSPQVSVMTVFLIKEQADQSLRFPLDHPLPGSQHRPFSFHEVWYHRRGMGQPHYKA